MTNFSNVGSFAKIKIESFVTRNSFPRKFCKNQDWKVLAREKFVNCNLFHSRNYSDDYKKNSAGFENSNNLSAEIFIRVKSSNLQVERKTFSNFYSSHHEQKIIFWQELFVDKLFLQTFLRTNFSWKNYFQFQFQTFRIFEEKCWRSLQTFSNRRIIFHPRRIFHHVEKVQSWKLKVYKVWIINKFISV